MGDLLLFINLVCLVLTVMVVWFSVNNENYKVIELDFLQNECLALMVEYLTKNPFEQEVTK